MLRVAGLPVGAVDALRATATIAWADRMLTLETSLDHLKSPATDVLEAAVGDATEDRLRHDLVALRRDVFNRRLPRDLARARRLTAGLGPSGRAKVAQWLDLREQYSLLEREGEDLLQGEISAGQEHLRALALDPRLRHGLMLASPSLDRYLPTYLEAPAGPLGKRARRIERSLLEYVYRTACKTSPFSSMTTVALGRFGPGGDGSALVVEGRIGGLGRSHPRLNVAALARLADVISGNADLRRDLPVEVTTGWSADSNRVRYVRRTRHTGDADAAMTFDSLEESLFFLSRGTVLKEVLEILENEPRIRLGELAERLHQQDPLGRDRAEVEAYLSRLLRLSLLTIPALQVDIHSADPLTGFREQVAQLGREWSDELADRLDLIRGHLHEFRSADPPGRRRLVEAIRSELTEAQHDLGETEVTTSRTLVYEDVCLPDLRVVADEEMWHRELVPALRGVSRILPLFDMMLPHRLSLKGFFLARYGRGGCCSDVLRFIHEFHRDFYGQLLKAAQRRQAFDENGDYLPQENWLRLPEITALDEARSELQRRMRIAYAELPPDARELVLDDDFFDAVAERLPASGLVFDPRSFFLQVANVDGAPLGVFNRSYSALTLLFSRFTHCFEEAAGDEARTAGLAAQLRDMLAGLQPEGAVFAELTGGYDTTNLNLHPPVTPYELVCPGENSTRPATAQIPVSDLIIVHDEATDRVLLRHRDLDVEVIPVYLGFLMPMALPEVQRALLLFSHTSMAALDLWSGVDHPLEDKTIGGHPRVRYRNLVLVRDTWKTHPDHLPNRAAASSDAEWFLAWQRWRHANGIPARVFVQTDNPRTSEEPDADQGGMRSIKPQYVDFDSYFSLCLLDQLVRLAGRRVVMQEMLPDIDQLWLRGVDGRYVTEQTIEITRTNRPLRG
ncbi:lantibiotic dehydratase [Sphaerimonospora sp. CA-214678]|uniref:lantibiotic dehydratase n=1 Tax=Sphaerimonospora sp. CA-214678 TaxID=3240029 RepID=UPI003D8C2644